MSKQKQHHPEFKAKVALEVLKGEETVSELAIGLAFHLNFGAARQTESFNLSVFKMSVV